MFVLWFIDCVVEVSQPKPSGHCTHHDALRTLVVCSSTRADLLIYVRSLIWQVWDHSLQLFLPLALTTGCHQFVLCPCILQKLWRLKVEGYLVWARYVVTLNWKTVRFMKSKCHDQIKVVGFDLWRIMSLFIFYIRWMFRSYSVCLSWGELRTGV